MMEFLRIVRRGKWEKHPTPDWPEDNGLDCDALSDMQTEECRLSVYAVTDEIDQQRVAVAHAATRKHISVIDYITFEGSGLTSLGITVNQTEGKTPDNGVNNLHYDLGNLTVKRLAQLTEIVSEREPIRIPEPCIRTLLRTAISDELLDRTKVKLSGIQGLLSSNV